MRRLLRLLPLGLLLLAMPLWAAPLTPQEQLTATTRQLMAELSTQRERVKQHPEQLLTLAESHLLPLFDINLMSRYVLAQQWKSATPEQQQIFEREFTNLVMRFYTAALMSDPKRIDQILAMGDKLIEYRPVADLNDSTTKVAVKATVNLPDGQTYPVDFRLHRRDATTPWRIYDLTVEGISLITNYRNTFGVEISRDGLAAMLARLQEKNAEMLESIRKGGGLKDKSTATPPAKGG